VKFPEENELDDFKSNKKILSIIQKPNELEISHEKKIILNNKKERSVNITKEENIVRTINYFLY